MATATTTRTETGMGPKKTLIIMVTVVGCVAILWPKVFYPMMVGNQQPKTNAIKDHRTGGCCDVVLDQDELLANESANLISHHAFRKTVHHLPEEHSIRQERPPLLRTEPMHPAMRERGRAIPTNKQSVPILERPPVPAKVVEGRPIPGMRPPLGAGSYQAPKQSATSMSFIMPLYTIGIVSFFIYTIMKLIFKKPQTTPYENVTPDPAFRSEVFTPPEVIKRPDDGTTKLGPENNAQLNGSGPAVETNGFIVDSTTNKVTEEPVAESIQEPIDFIIKAASMESFVSKPVEEAKFEPVEQIETSKLGTEPESVSELVESLLTEPTIQSIVIKPVKSVKVDEEPSVMTPVIEPVQTAVKVSVLDYAFVTKSKPEPIDTVKTETEPVTVPVEQLVTEPTIESIESATNKIINEPVIVADSNAECVTTEDISDKIIDTQAEEDDQIKEDSQAIRPKVTFIPMVVEGEEVCQINEVTDAPKPEITEIIIEKKTIIEELSIPEPSDEVPVKILDDEAEYEYVPRKRTVSFSNQVESFERDTSHEQKQDSINEALLDKIDQAEQNFEDTNTAREDVRMAEMFLGGHFRVRRVSFKSDEIEKDPYSTFDEIGVVETLTEDKKFELMRESKRALEETSEQLSKDENNEVGFVTMLKFDEQPLHIMVPSTPTIEDKSILAIIRETEPKTLTEAESIQIIQKNVYIPVMDPEPLKEPEKISTFAFTEDRIDQIVSEMFSRMADADKEQNKKDEEEPNMAEVEVYLGNRKRTRSITFRRSSFVEDEYSKFQEVGVPETISKEKERELKSETSAEIQKALEAAAANTMRFIGSRTVHIDDDEEPNVVAKEPEVQPTKEETVIKSVVKDTQSVIKTKPCIQTFEAAVVEEIKPSLDLYFSQKPLEPVVMPLSPVQEASPIILGQKEDKVDIKPVQFEDVQKAMKEIEELVKPQNETVLVEKITEQLVDVQRETEKTAQVVKELVEIVTVILEPEMPPELKILETKHVSKAVEEAKANGNIKEIEISVSEEPLETVPPKIYDTEDVEIIKKVIDSVSESLSKTHEFVDKVIDEAVSITAKKEPAVISGIEKTIDNVIFGAANDSLAQIEKVSEAPSTSEKLEQQIRELSSSVAESTEKIRIKLLPNENLNLKWIDGKLVATTESEHLSDIEAKLLAFQSGSNTTVPKIDSDISEDDTLLELDLLRRKLDETERAMSKIIAKMGSLPIKGQESSNESHVTANGHMKSTDDSHQNHVEKVQRKRDTSADRGTIKVMGMEMTASHENSPRKRPVTPTLMSSSRFEPPTIEDDTPKAHEIYLKGSLPHESKILVSDSETAVEDTVQTGDEEYDQDEAPVILSGKMTLSLINMDHMEKEALVGDIEIEKEPFEDAEEYRKDKLEHDEHTVNEE